MPQERIGERELKTDIGDNNNNNNNMGWVTDNMADEPTSVFYEVACNFTASDVKRKLTDYGGENASPCEFFTDYLRDYYKVSTKTLTVILTLLKEFYGDKLPYFYYTEKK